VAELILRAGQAGADDPERTGHKMARLAELGRAGLVVPESFVVTIEAYERHMTASGLGARVDELLSQLDGLAGPGGTDEAAGQRELAAGRAELEAVAGRVGEAFTAVPVEAGVAAAIAAGYAELGGDGDAGYAGRAGGGSELRVAVRSSACGEDSAAASFAGVFETYLGVSGADRVTDAVRSCWASLYDARALAYRIEHGLDHRSARMAVGVVALVDARSSGVAFSVHPRTGKRDRVVIEANWGWGGALVQGLVVPDRVEVDRDDRRVLRHDVASKDVISAFDEAAGMVAEMPMPPGLRDRAVLDDEQIGQIVAAVLAVEERYGHPVDVEWVLDRSGGPPWVVQARPVTGLPDREPVTGWDPVRYAFGDTA
jgi:pyruvate, water dikinase